MRILHLSIYILPFAIGNLTPHSSATAQTILHVSPHGNDAAAGSPDKPLKTLRGAQQQMRKRFASGASHWVRVEIAPGRYYLDTPLVLTREDSGESLEKNVTFAAKGGEVTISGGQEIVRWRQAGDRWVAAVPANFPAPRDLWVNGRHAIRARSPNQGFFRIDRAGADNRSSFTVLSADLLHLEQPQTAEVVFLHDWSISRVRLDGIEAATRTYRFADRIGADQSPFGISNFEPHPRYFVENAPELLDAPGEWYFDESSRKLSYRPRAGEMLQAAQTVVPRLEQLVTLRGEQSKPVENISFDGLTFSHSRFDLPPHGYAGIQACVHERRTKPGENAEVVMTAAVLIDHARGCSIKNCRFEHLAGSGMRIERSRDCRVGKSVFHDIGGNGVMIGSTFESTAPVSQKNVVENCLIENCGAAYFGAVGLWVGIAANTAIENNELRDLPYSGISIGWCWGDAPTPCRDNQIRRNRIHDVMLMLSDGGGIYTLGRQPGTVLAENLIYDIPPNAGRAQSNGIFMDQGSTEIRVEHNTIYHVARSPIRFNMAGINMLVKNRLATPSGVPTLYDTNPKTVLANNEEITNAAWQPPADDPVFKLAGPTMRLAAP